VRLEFTPPLFPDNLFGHLVATAVPGVEEWRDGAYRRTTEHGIVELRPRGDHIEFTGPAEAVPVCRFLLDLDADPVAIDAHLAGDPALAPLVAAAPGRRVPRTTDAAEMALRAVLGQQVSTAAARTHAARLVRDVGEPVGDMYRFPSPAAVAAIDPERLALPKARRRTLIGLAAALADGLDLHDTDALLALPGIGPWTVGTIRMRALGDRDAFVASDLGVRAALRALGDADPDRWRPYRAYAVQHLWALGDHAVNRMPD
jgi:AraC family transcriptional regulator of adaptative response / DNA-3-methyladenine glycosylase II